MASRQDQNSGTTSVRENLEFDVAALEAYMRRHVKGFSGKLTVEQFKGGQSNPTYKLTAGGASYVLRRKPPGQLLKSAHAIDREYRVLSALGKIHAPVARTYALCEDESVIGTAFFIMEFVDGRIFWESALPDETKASRAAIYDSMNDAIAKLHMVDFRAVGLSDYGRTENYISRQIDRWTKQYEASKTEEIEAMDKLMAWLPQNIPADQPGREEASIAHGDFRIDNLIFHKTEPRVIAILDWELSTLGHPLADFAYVCMLWRFPPHIFMGMSGLDLKSLGIPAEEEFVAAYCKRTGRSGIPHWDFYIAFSMFRLAAILQGIMGRVVAGTATSDHAKTNGKLARPLAELAWRQAQKAGAQA